MASTSATETCLELNTLPEIFPCEEKGGIDHTTESLQYALLPADRGKDAYLVLAAGTILEGLVWAVIQALQLPAALPSPRYPHGAIPRAAADLLGFPVAFGVFQDYYSSHSPFDQDLGTIPAIGTSSTGIAYLACPLVYGVLKRFPRWRKSTLVGGFIVLTISLIAASFARNTMQLLATQGVMYGVGAATLYAPAFLYLDEWFIARRGLAYGIVWAGAGIFGIAIPLAMQWMLEQYGYRTALRVWAVFGIVTIVPCLILLKGRLPVQHASTGPQRMEFGFLKSSAFWILQLANIIQGLGYYMPALYLPLFAQSVGLSALAGTIAISIMNGTVTFGALGAGFLIDRYHVTTVMNICAIGTVVACLLFWTFAVHVSMLFLFAILYGIFAGGYASTWAGVTAPVRQKYPAVDNGMIISFMSAGKGVGAVISGPLSTALVRSSAGWKQHASFGFGSGYGLLIMFSAVTAALSTIGWVGKKCGMV